MCVNRIKEILKERGFEDVRPSDATLSRLGISRHLWTKWVNKTADPELRHLQPLGEWLYCSINEIMVIHENVDAA
jgi:transcriptional regulator with XRE-family HTH domain